MLGDSNARENGRFEQSYDTEYDRNSGGEKICMYFEDSGSHLGSDNDIRFNLRNFSFLNVNHMRFHFSLFLIFEKRKSFAMRKIILYRR